MKKKSARTSRFFDRIGAKGWHKSQFFTYTWKYPALRGWLASQLSPKERLVLSVGCGSGELEKDFSKRGVHVVGVDISYEMLLAASRRGLRNLVNADARFLPFRDECFDLVMFLESFGYVESELVLRETKRVLKKRGRLLMTAYPVHHDSDSLYKKHSLQEIAGQLRQAGFRIRDHRMLVPGRNRVSEVTSEDRAVLLFTVSQKPA